MNRAAWVLLGGLALSATAHAQPSQVSVSAAAQIVAADRYRLGGQDRVEPDLGISWVRPAIVQGTLGLDVHLVRREDRLQVGRGLFSVKDAKVGGITWEVTAGDTGTPPFVPDFGFSNLQAPTLTFAGASVSAATSRVTVRAAGDRTTQTRNIFGTDHVDLRQTLAQADVTVRLNRRLQVSARGSQVRNGDLGPYPTFVDWAEDAGAGLLVQARPGWQFSADAGVSRFQRRGTRESESAPSWLVGTRVTGEWGRVEVNAQRFSVGRFAALNYPYSDRQGIFASGDWAPIPAIRFFGGLDVARTNLDPDASLEASMAMPEGRQTRGFGGTRVKWGRHSTFTVRAEGGGRDIRPSRFSPGFETDTGATSAEWYAALGRTTVSTRYERRTNVDANYAPSSFRQHEVSSQVFVSFPKGRQVFAQGFIIRRADRAGGGETDWYAGGGFQMPVSALHVRLEGTIGRTDDWDTASSSNRQMLVAGVSGTLGRRLSVSADVVLHHAPLGLEGSRPWSARSMIRVTRTLTFGSPLVLAGAGALPMTGPMGSVAGVVFVDWDGNGRRDPGDDPAADVSLLVVNLGASSAGRDGQALFSRVPAGERLVSLDLSTVPADYDLPGDTVRTVEVTRGKRATVEFGLIPTGTITGSVFTDTDGDGALGEGDAPMEGAAVTLDDGARTELTRGGHFRFDNVRLGPHTIGLELDSVGTDAVIVGGVQHDVALSRDTRTGATVFLVQQQKRPEVRKVFPSKKIEVPNPAGAADGAEPNHSAPVVTSVSPAPRATGGTRRALKPPRKPARSTARSKRNAAARSHRWPPRPTAAQTRPAPAGRRCQPSGRPREA